MIMYLKRNLLIALIFFSLSLTVTAQTYHKGESLLKGGVMIIPSEGGRLVGFVENSTGKIGFAMNTSGLEIRHEAVFDDFYNENFWKSERIIVRKDGKWGAIGHELKNMGQIVIPFIYDSMTPFKDGISLVSLNDEIFYIDLNGNRVED